MKKVKNIQKSRLKILFRKRFTAEEQSRHFREFRDLERLEMPFLNLHFKLCFLLQTDCIKVNCVFYLNFNKLSEFQEFYLRDPNFSAALDYFTHVLGIDQTFMNESFQRKTMFDSKLHLVV